MGRVLLKMPPHRLGLGNAERIQAVMERPPRIRHRNDFLAVGRNPAVPVLREDVIFYAVQVETVASRLLEVREPLRLLLARGRIRH